MTQDQEDTTVQAVVTDALQHDGVTLPVGAQIALPLPAFQKLAALNVVAQASEAGVPAAPEVPLVDLKARVRAAINQLEPGDFDADAQPKLGAVKERLPEEARKVTAKLVAEVWAEIARPT